MGKAVNTVINDDGVLTGITTDGVSFIKVLKENNLDPIGKKITIVELVEQLQLLKYKQL